MSIYQPVGRNLAPCGTAAAYRRHLRHREPPCEACKQANRRRVHGGISNPGLRARDYREVRNGLPVFRPYRYRGAGYDIYEPDDIEALLRQVIHVLACALGAGRQQQP